MILIWTYYLWFLLVYVLNYYCGHEPLIYTQSDVGHGQSGTPEQLTLRCIDFLTFFENELWNNEAT